MPLDHAQRSSFDTFSLPKGRSVAKSHHACDLKGYGKDRGQYVGYRSRCVERCCAQSGSKCTGRTDSHGTLFLVQEEACNHVCFVGCCSWRAGSDKEMYSTPVLSESALDTDSKRGGVHVNCAQALAQRQ